MNNIIFKTSNFKYEISLGGKNKSFLFSGDENNYISETPFAFITNHDKSKIESISA